MIQGWYPFCACEWFNIWEKYGFDLILVYHVCTKAWQNNIQKLCILIGRKPYLLSITLPAREQYHNLNFFLKEKQIFSENTAIFRSGLKLPQRTFLRQQLINDYDWLRFFSGKINVDIVQKNTKTAI